MKIDTKRVLKDIKRIGKEYVVKIPVKGSIRMKEAEG